MHNNGSKTGSELGCTLQINVPVAMPVSDDNSNQGPLRIALGGKVDAPHHMTGIPGASAVVLVEEPGGTPRSFAWTATQP